MVIIPFSEFIHKSFKQSLVLNAVQQIF